MNQTLKKDTDYWIVRHKKYHHSLRSVGLKSFSERANQYLYRLVRERYQPILSQLALPAGARVVDMGAGTGQYIDLFLSLNFQVTACDISGEALKVIQDSFPGVITKVGKISELNFTEKYFDLVHCFDVLYHILEPAEWLASIRKLCNLSKRYISIHGLFSDNKPAKTAWHVRHRSYQEMKRIFEENGFYEKGSIITHKYAMRFPFYFLRNLSPKFFYNTDKSSSQSFKGNNYYAIKIFVCR